MPDKTDAPEKRESKNSTPQESVWVELVETLLLPPSVAAKLAAEAAKGAVKGAADAAKEKPPSEAEKEKSKVNSGVQPDVTDIAVAAICTAAPILCGPAEALTTVIKEGVKRSINSGRAVDMVIDGKPRCKAPQSAQDIMNEIYSAPTDVYNYFKNKPLKATAEFMLFPPIGLLNAKLDKCTLE